MPSEDERTVSMGEASLGGAYLSVEEASAVNWERVIRLERYMLDRASLMAVRVVGRLTEGEASEMMRHVQRRWPELARWHNNTETRLAGELVEEW